MTLRVGFDMDGVLADFGSAYRDIESELFGPDTAATAPDDPEAQPEEPAGAKPTATAVSPKESDRRRRAVWERIRATQDFWTTLKPTDPGAVRRIHALMLNHRWEVVFITQRPSTAGEPVQRQTQRWLVAQGFDLPSVVVIAGSRGAAIHALRLTHHVDDSPQNCVDVKTDSAATPILIVRRAEDAAARQARKLGMGVATSIRECLDVLEQASTAAQPSGVLQRIAALVNWSS
jgi:beta-phosphoglucomutase-like phosphatase (HAD superfamily)